MELSEHVKYAQVVGSHDQMSHCMGAILYTPIVSAGVSGSV